jgi:phosphatidylglycerol:prolipoprotein diacylglycerol transferase
MVAGILTAYLLGVREEKRLGMPKDAMLDMVLVAVPCGIVGARLYYVLMSLDQFRANPIAALYIWEGGVAIYGAVIGGALGVYVHSRIKKRSFLALLDLAAPGLALAQAIGRWGNYFNREAYGPVITDAAWWFFPAGVLIDEGGVPVWHVATFFYESMWNVAVFAALWLMRKRMKMRGDLFLWYMAMYGAGRFLVEQLRTDSLYLFGFRASQYLSLLLCIAIAAVFLWRQAKARGLLAALPSVLACAIPFVRLLLPVGLASAMVSLALALACGALLLSDGGRPRFALWWLVADTLVYVVLLCLNLGFLWHSPYFAYAGLSLPPYLAVAYARMPAAAPAAQAGEG